MRTKAGLLDVIENGADPGGAAFHVGDAELVERALEPAGRVFAAEANGPGGLRFVGRGAAGGGFDAVEVEAGGAAVVHGGEIVPLAVGEVGGAGDVDAGAAFPPELAVAVDGEPPVAGAGVGFLGEERAVVAGGGLVGCGELEPAGEFVVVGKVELGGVGDDGMLGGAVVDEGGGDLAGACQGGVGGGVLWGRGRIVDGGGVQVPDAGVAAGPGGAVDGVGGRGTGVGGGQGVFPGEVSADELLLVGAEGAVIDDDFRDVSVPGAGGDRAVLGNPAGLASSGGDDGDEFPAAAERGGGAVDGGAVEFGGAVADVGAGIGGIPEIAGGSAVEVVGVVVA